MAEICITGGGPAGVMAAIFAAQNPENKVYIYDKGIILNTLLPTGGGRCNLAFGEYNFKELAKFYLRGEKFLYSVFSRFSTADTLEFFEKIGVKTYTQEDLRIFPVTDCAKDVKQALLKQLDKNIKKVFEKVVDIKKENEKFVVKTDKNTREFDSVVVATGGRGTGQRLVKGLGHNIVELRPALSSLITREKDFAQVSGISVKNVTAQVFFENKKVKTLTGDLLFTHTGISGPLVYKISSYCAYLDFCKDNPLKIELNLVGGCDFAEFDAVFLNALKNNAQKETLNVLADFVPKNLALAILCRACTDPKTRAGQLSGVSRKAVSKCVSALTFNAVSLTRGEEIVTAGGVDLKEIESKTMESKLVKGLYFCGEVIDVDGLTGGFNLQNCWSTGFVAGCALRGVV